MRRLTLILIVLLCCAWTAQPTPTPVPQQYAWNVMQLGGGENIIGPTPTAAPTPAPGNSSITLDEDFSADNGNWAIRSSTEETCGIAAGEITLEGDGGICHYSGADQGTQPTSRNQWAVLEHGVTVVRHRGLVLRAASGAGDPGPFVYNYAARCSADFLIRSCSADSACSTIAAFDSPCTSAEGDQIAFAVDGEGDSTELCAWYWAAADSDPSDWTDPTTWGNPGYCTSADGAIDNTNMLALIDTVPGEIIDWHTETNTGPDDLLDRGFPDEGQLDVGIYSGGDAPWTVEWMMAGDLD